MLRFLFIWGLCHRTGAGASAPRVGRFAVGGDNAVTDGIHRTMLAGSVNRIRPKRNVFAGFDLQRRLHVRTSRALAGVGRSVFAPVASACSSSGREECDAVVIMARAAFDIVHVVPDGNNRVSAAFVLQFFDFTNSVCHFAFFSSCHQPY